ncbi:MAG: hypothetical protein ACLFT4_05505 [Bacteroidales bacterium]
MKKITTSTGETKYVIHFLSILRKDEVDFIPSSINKPNEMYEMAVNKSKPFGGKKYRGKDFGGGIAFKTTSKKETEELIENIVHPKIINDGNANYLIPVHINRSRDDKYFYDWSFDNKEWIRGNKIPKNIKKAYKNPTPGNHYKTL